MYAWLIKSDINGNLLWSKSIFSQSYQIAFSGVDGTADGGFILTGGTTKLDYFNFDIDFIKFNACGEKEWCDIISTPGNDDYGVKIKQIPKLLFEFPQCVLQFLHQRNDEHKRYHL